MPSFFLSPVAHVLFVTLWIQSVQSFSTDVLGPRHLVLISRHTTFHLRMAENYVDVRSKTRRRMIYSTFASALPFWQSTVKAKSVESIPPTRQELQNYRYSSDWTGTALKLLSLEDAYKKQESSPVFDFGQWPDVILRRAASPIPESFFRERGKLSAIANALRATARKVGAVGLAAQQCGIDARLVFLEDDANADGLFLVNPQIIARSPELDMVVWTENCLVLPPTFKATVLRDLWITVKYQTLTGETTQKTLHGELSRAAQHEFDHQRGILILDHIGLEDMESNDMRRIEQDGHEERMKLAYYRYLS